MAILTFVFKWFKDPNNRKYDYFVFLPAQEAPANVYNKFKFFEGPRAEKYVVNVYDS